MAVRFLPPPEERPSRSARSRATSLRSSSSAAGFAGRSQRLSRSRSRSSSRDRSRGARPGRVPAARGEAPGGAWPRLVEAPLGRGRAAATRTAGPAAAAGSVSAAGGQPGFAAAGEPAAAEPGGFGGGTADALDDGPTAYETSVKLLARAR